MDAFMQQHHVSVNPLGQVSVFDNKGDGLARVIRMEVDAGEVEIVQELTTSLSCPIQGSGFRLSPGGNVLAACAEQRTVVELASDGSTPWQATLSCTGSSPAGSGPYRAIPIEL